MNLSIEELVENNFFLRNSGLELIESLFILTKSEILDFTTEYFPDLRINRNNSKIELLNQLISFENENVILKRLKQKWTFIVPCFSEFIQLFKLLFFGNTTQDLSAFILEDIGVLRYEPYQIRDEDRWFNDRKLVEGYLSISNQSEVLWLASENRESEIVDQVGTKLQSEDFHLDLNRKKEKLFIRIGQYYEKQGQLEEALFYYSLTSISLAKERRIRILAKSGKFKEAIIELVELESSDVDENTKDFVRIFKPKLNKQLGLAAQVVKRESFIETTIELKRNINQKIEIQVMNYYQELNYEGFYTENLIWTALFGLVFWDIQFMPLKGVFFNPFQRGPADLFSPDFKTLRENQILEKLREIGNNDWEAKVLNTYDDKYLTANYLVPWKRISRMQIKTLINKVPAEDIRSILTRMAGNLSDFTSGFPDLVIFYPQSNTYQLIEVKGPGDQLRPNQKRWLRYFEKNKIPYSVVRVKWL